MGAGYFGVRSMHNEVMHVRTRAGESSRPGF